MNHDHRHLPQGRAMMLVLLLLLVVASEMASATMPDCRCNHGIILATRPRCTCVCEAAYLLPHCIFTATDITPMELWLRGNATQLNVPTTSPTSTVAEDAWSSSISSTTTVVSGEDIMMDVAGAFGMRSSMEASNAGFGFERMAIASHSGNDAKHINTAMDVCVLRVVMKMPGWAAQQLLADAHAGTLKAYSFPISSSSSSSSSSPSSSSMQLIAVYGLHISPYTLPLYVNEWMRFYTSTTGNTYISLEQCGWLVGGVVLVVGLVLMEQVCLFNTEHNVGGGPTRAIPRSDVVIEGETEEMLPIHEKKKSGMMMMEHDEGASRRWTAINASPGPPPPSSSQQQQQQHRSRSKTAAAHTSLRHHHPPPPWGRATSAPRASRDASPRGGALLTHRRHRSPSFPPRNVVVELV